MDHTFAVCAYKESPYLKECIASLKRQRQKSHIIMATSTPCEYIEETARENGIPLYVNEGEKGITQDWNFAYRMARSDYVTIAHQDDVYHEDYVSCLSQWVGRSKHPLIFFTDYAELRDGRVIGENTLLRVKRLLLLPLRMKGVRKTKFARWFSLAFGTAVCCPSVTFYRPNCPEEPFQHHFRADEDWEAWERLYRLRGDFVYCPRQLCFHRIHGESETSRILAAGRRSEEDYIMFRKFWIRPLAFILNKCYSLSQESNELV